MSFVDAAQVTLDYDACSREDALRYLANHSVKLGFSNDADEVYKAFLAREAEAETGLVAGFAVPHAKSDAITEAGIAVLKLKAPVEWPSFDDMPVDIALALYVPAGEAGTTHLRLLSKAAVMLMDESFRNKLRESSNAEDIALMVNAGLE